MPRYRVHVECCYKSVGEIEAEGPQEAEALALSEQGLTHEYDDDCYTSAELMPDEQPDPDPARGRIRHEKQSTRRMGNYAGVTSDAARRRPHL